MRDGMLEPSRDEVLAIFFRLFNLEDEDFESEWWATVFGISKDVMKMARTTFDLFVA